MRELLRKVFGTDRDDEDDQKRNYKSHNVRSLRKSRSASDTKMRSSMNKGISESRKNPRSKLKEIQPRSNKKALARITSSRLDVYDSEVDYEETVDSENDSSDQSLAPISSSERVKAMNPAEPSYRQGAGRTRTCLQCFSIKSVEKFVNVLNPQCECIRNVCTRCFRKLVEGVMVGTVQGGVRCPRCNTGLKDGQDINSSRIVQEIQPAGFMGSDNRGLSVRRVASTDILPIHSRRHTLSVLDEENNLDRGSLALNNSGTNPIERYPRSSPTSSPSPITSTINGISSALPSLAVMASRQKSNAVLLRMQNTREVSNSALTTSLTFSEAMSPFSIPLSVESPVRRATMPISSMPMMRTAPRRASTAPAWPFKPVSLDSAVMSSSTAPHLRSQPKLPTLAPAALLPPQVNRECDTCLETNPTRTHFFSRITTKCKHLVSTCKDCVREYLAERIKDGSALDLKCPFPNCDCSIGPNEIRLMADDNLLEKYEHVTLRAALREDPNYRDCPTPGCLGGHIHIPDDPNDTLFICPLCKRFVCMEHNVDHSGETCAHYERRTKDKRQNERASEAAIKATSKACPKCKAWIQKSFGCDHMTCSRCTYEFCYVCGADYNRIRRDGNSAHLFMCTAHPNNLPPVPSNLLAGLRARQPRDDIQALNINSPVLRGFAGHDLPMIRNDMMFEGRRDLEDALETLEDGLSIGRRQMLYLRNVRRRTGGPEW